MLRRVATASLFGVVMLCAGFALGLKGEDYLSGISQIVTDENIRQRQSNATLLTSPLLECAELPETVSPATLKSLKQKIQTLETSRENSGDITYASVYFRDLSNGPWFGINESDSFFPASLLKLPIAISFYEMAEHDPGILSREVVYEPDPAIAIKSQPFSPQQNLVKGQKYTIENMIAIMLQQSSNEATVALSEIAGDAQISQVFRDLGLPEPARGENYKIDTHKYASFFRILYNATYLDRVASENMLKLLTKASFEEGLVAGVADGVTVAHKFGSADLDSGKLQLHDCGIVYVPGKPYILCVMSQGNSFPNLTHFIRDVSREVYAAVTRSED